MENYLFQWEKSFGRCGQWRIKKKKKFQRIIKRRKIKDSSAEIGSSVGSEAKRYVYIPHVQGGCFNIKQSFNRPPNVSTFIMLYNGSEETNCVQPKVVIASQLFQVRITHVLNIVHIPEQNISKLG